MSGKNPGLSMEYGLGVGEAWARLESSTLVMHLGDPAGVPSSHTLPGPTLAVVGI